MFLRHLASALVFPVACLAISSSHPWIVLSTSKFVAAPSPDLVQPSSEVLRYTKGLLDTCPTERYLIISQPDAHAADLSRRDGSSVPHLRRAVHDRHIQSRYIVPEVIGDAGDAKLAEHIKMACSKKGLNVAVDEVSLASIAFHDRENILSENDALIADDLDSIMKSDSFTIIYVSGPAEMVYEPEFVDESVQMHLKRHLQSEPVRRRDNSTRKNVHSLFEKYQFFTPGIFMAIVVTVILLSTLGVGIKALSSLEVSYGAFEKETGPTTQKKLQ